MPPRKYQPLAAYLAALPPETATAALSFAEIEALLGAPLPRSARTPQFWTNVRQHWGGSAQARAWRRAGWRVAGVRWEPRPPVVTFERLPSR